MTETYTVDAQGRRSIIKDPRETLDYTFDFAEDLALVGEDIAAAEFTVSGATLEASSFSGTKAVGWVSGGTNGTVATVSCCITMTGIPARIIERSVFLRVRDR